MRTLFFIFCILGVTQLHARSPDSTLHRYRLQGSYVFAMPQGAFSSRQGDHFIAGLARPTSAANFSLGVRISNHLSVGVHVCDANYRLNNNNIFTLLKNLYSSPGYYTTVSLMKNNYEIVSSAVDLSYTQKLDFAEVEPYVSIGMGSGRAINAVGSLLVHRKKMNDNYSEDLSLTLGDGRTFFYPGVGICMNKKIFKLLFGSVGIQYNYGVMHYTLLNNKTDYLQNSINTSQSFTQIISALSMQAGLQFRFRKFHKHNKYSTE